MTCHGCNSPIEPIAAIRTYHSGCDPQMRVEMLERALAELAAHFEEAINYIDDPSRPENEIIGPTLIVLAGRNRLKAARAALEYRPAQMKGREG
jgi:hypothetical protein